tara:strand:+ start:25154 stop:25594 length:441 start_codon:yes stop_codon:yes gene_type:complete
MPKKKTKKEQLEDKIIFLENLGGVYAKRLIKNRTTWESSLYQTLKDLHYKFEFQVPLVVNKTKKPQLFILDFLLTDYNLILEADGAKYHTSKKDVSSDNKRTKLLRKEGYDILRLFNKQISTFSKELVQQIIQQKLKLMELSKTSK